MKKLTIILLFFASVLQGQTGAAYWHGSTEPGTITPETDTLTLTYWDDFVLLHIANTGITEDANGVSQWQDRSGNGNHSTQSVNTNKPSTDGSGNVVFDGVDNYLTMTDIWASVNDSAFTVFVVFETDLADRQKVFELSKSNVYYHNLLLLGAGSDVDATVTSADDDGNGSNNQIVKADTIAINTNHLIVIPASENTSTDLKINGAGSWSIDNTSPWTGFSGPDLNQIGAGNNATQDFFSGKILFFGIANRKFTPAEIATTESELNSFFTIY